MYYVGVDGGGTKTLFRVTDENLNKIFELELNTSHFGQVGYEGLKNVLQEGVNTITQKFGENVFFSLGLAGYGEVYEIRKNIETVTGDVFKNNKYLLHNDAQIAVYGALGGKDGIVMIAGTGSIAMAHKDGKWYRKGGWGYLIDDAGSAYDIGKQALKKFARMAEDLETKDVLYDIIIEHFDLEKPMDLIAILFANSADNRNFIAKISELVYKARQKNSKVSEEIFLYVAKEHLAFINALSPLFSDQYDISYIGGVYRSGDYILKPLESLGVKMKAPIHDSCNGAILLAQNNFKK